MNIIIVGAGKIGRELIEHFSREDHDLTVIDENAELVDRLTEDYDIMGICGSGTICSVLKEANAAHADILAATTAKDEINMICCMIARKMGAKNCIARVRNVEYTAQTSFMREEMGINVLVNPEYDAAKEISRVISFPAAIKIDTFAKGRLDLAEFKIDPGSGLDGKSLREINKSFSRKFLICAAQRGEEVFIPNGDFILREGDRIHITAEHKELVKFLRDMGLQQQKIKSVMIIGGGTIAYHLAKRLAETGVHVTIIEIDEKVCVKLSNLLPKAEIICADGTDQEVLTEQGIEHVDACVSLTGIDEENIIVSLYAKVKGADKVITKVNKVSLMNILDSIGLDTIISPKSITSDIIMRYSRSVRNAEGGHIKTLYKIVDGKAEALEFVATAEFDGLDVPLKDLKLKNNVLVAGILRKEEFFIPGGDDAICAEDRVIVVTAGNILKDLDEIIK